MKRKYQIIHFTIYEKNILEAYLNDMARQGWQIEWMSSYIICFASSHEHFYYTVEYNQNNGFINDEIDAPEQQIELYEELDYEFICSTKYFSIYRSLKSNDFSTDEDLQKRNFTETRKKMNRTISTAFVIFLSLFLPNVFFQSRRMLLLSSNFLIATFLGYLFYLLTAVFLRLKHFSTIKQILLRTHVIILIFIIILSYFVFSYCQFSKDVWATILAIVFAVNLLLSFAVAFKSNDHKTNWRVFSYVSNFILILGLILRMYAAGNDTSKATEIIDSSYYGNRIINNYYESESFLLKYFSSHMSSPSQFTFLSENSLSYTYYIDKSTFLHDEIMKKLNQYHDFSYTTTIDHVDIYCDDYSDDNTYTDMLFIKENHYLLFHSNFEWNDTTLKEFIQSIHWQ